MFHLWGRQLGKTALLHDVRYRTHDLSAGRCALYVDLRVHGIGYTHGPDRIWHKLAELLAEQKVVPAGLPSNIRGETLLRHVEEWLADSPERRILLLLDEADKFLEADSQDEFMRCAEIKGAMERTSRRFKVVFSVCTTYFAQLVKRIIRSHTSARRSVSARCFRIRSGARHAHWSKDHWETLATALRVQI